MDATRTAELLASRDMEPVAGAIDVQVPAGALWEAFRDPSKWPRWNASMFWCLNHDLVEGERLVWCFNAIERRYPYKLPALAEIIDVGAGQVTWQVDLMGLFAHHTYTLTDLGNGWTRFASWEKATGPSFRLLRRFWLAHFTFVRNASLAGARLLEELYRQEGALALDRLADPLPAPLRPIRAAIDEGAWLWSQAVLDAREVAPGIHLVTGGCNSVVVAAAREALVVDPKFPPWSVWLRWWIRRHMRVPVTRIVNTHFHFDHTEGNDLYPGAELVAHPAARSLMATRDARFWRRHAGGLPAAAGAVRLPTSFDVGRVHVTVAAIPTAHTRSDVVVYLRRDDAEVVVTGDVLFNHCYPFLDTGQGGSDVAGIVERLRRLADEHPAALFVPGHGPLASAADLHRYADYLTYLDRAVARARVRGLSEDEAVGSIDLSAWDRLPLPVLHYGTAATTAAQNIRQMYRLQHGGSASPLDRPDDSARH